MGQHPEELKSCLRGVIGFGVTPFKKDLSIDAEALRQNAAQLAQDCNVVVPLGNNGEIYSLSPQEHQVVGRTVVEQVRGRKPVLIGVGFSITVASALARAAEEYGADGILALPPYMKHAGEEGLFEYYRNLAQSIKCGLVLFQTPEFDFSPALLRRLSEIPNIVGLKDEHGDMKLFVRQLAAVGDRLALLCGVGEILAPSYFALGIKGFTSGLINFMPRKVLSILELLRNGDLQAAARMVADNALPFFDLRAKRPGYTTVVIKEAMNLCGRRAGPVRPPLAALAPEDREELRGMLDRLGLIKV